MLNSIHEYPTMMMKSMTVMLTMHLMSIHCLVAAVVVAVVGSVENDDDDGDDKVNRNSVLLV